MLALPPFMLVQLLMTALLESAALVLCVQLPQRSLVGTLDTLAFLLALDTVLLCE